MPDSRSLADVMADWYEQRSEGVEPGIEEMVRAHPDLADDLRDKFAAMEFLDHSFAAPPNEAGAIQRNIHQSQSVVSAL